MPNFSAAEKSFVCAVKAKVFMEYPPKGNEVGLNFANEALSLLPNETKWMIIWLKAKGRVRRFYNKSKTPDKDEIDTAETLSNMTTNCRSQIQAGNLFMEVASTLQLKPQYREESDNYYKLSSDFIG